MVEDDLRKRRKLIDSGRILVILSILIVMNIDNNMVQLSFYKKAILAVSVILVGDLMLRAINRIISRRFSS